MALNNAAPPRPHLIAVVPENGPQRAPPAQAQLPARSAQRREGGVSTAVSEL